jgi:GNAT superfamily N-acetyltransferase
MNETADPYVVAAHSGSELADSDRAVCAAILAEGGAVNVRAAGTELPRARVVVTVRRDNAIVGVGAIKRERPDYASEKAELSAFDFDANTLELGYVAVTREHRNRGLSSRIVEALTAEYHGRLFATTDDEYMKKTLARARFTQRGEPWQGQRGQLSLWIRDSRVEVIDSLQVEIRDRIAAFRSKLPAAVDGFAISRESKLPFKAVWYREALLWRMTELSSSAYESLENDLLASGILLTRGAVETAAAVWYLCGKLEVTSDSGLIGSVDEDLMSLLMGSRSNPDLPKATNVLTFVDCVDKEVEGFRRQYDGLSEFAHPNWSGTTLLYSKPDPQNLGAKFAANIRTSEAGKLIAVVNLSVALTIFERSYNRISEVLPRFVSVCERSIPSDRRRSNIEFER